MSYYDKFSINSCLLMTLDEYMYHLDTNLLASVYISWDEGQMSSGVSLLMHMVLHPTMH